jgi:acyl carrier protein
MAGSSRNLNKQVLHSLEGALRAVKGDDIKLDESTDLRADLSLDSLDMAEVIMHIEKQYGLGVEHELDRLLDTLIEEGRTGLHEVCRQLTHFLKRAGKI